MWFSWMSPWSVTRSRRRLPAVHNRPRVPTSALFLTISAVLTTHPTMPNLPASSFPPPSTPLRRLLDTDGYLVVPHAIPSAACSEFVGAAWEWLEGFEYGFKREERSTWDARYLPDGPTGGLYNRYAVGHEGFVWKIRT